MDDLNRNSNAIVVSFHTHYCRNCGADGDVAGGSVRRA
jgi:hypothetical protein